MQLLDRYILSKFIKSYIFVVFIIIALICIIDYTEKTDNFAESNAPTELILFDYYANYIPFIANTLSPIAIFIAAVFTTSRLASHTEIVAMQSAGMSFFRLLRPYLVGASCVAIMIFCFVGWIVPNASKVKVAFEHTYIRGPFFYDTRNIHFRVSDSTYLYLESYNNRVHTGYKFTLEQIEGRNLISKLSSDRLTWVDSIQKWHVGPYTLQEFKENGKQEISKGDGMDTIFNLLPKDFENDYKLHETLTFDEIDDFVEKQRIRGVGNVERYLYEKYERQAYPFAIILLTIMGVIVSMKKSRHGSGMQIVLGFSLAFAYILFAVMSRNIAQAGSLPTLISAWIPNMTFTLISIALYYKMID